MEIGITIREIFDMGKWKRFCSLKGWNEWCVNEGRVKLDDIVILSEEQARDLGIIEFDKCDSI
jgi:hypothetical protein